jgi:hypothetical protein
MQAKAGIPLQHPDKKRHTVNLYIRSDRLNRKPMPKKNSLTQFLGD